MAKVAFLGGPARGRDVCYLVPIVTLCSGSGGATHWCRAYCSFLLYSGPSVYGASWFACGSCLQMPACYRLSLGSPGQRCAYRRLFLMMTFGRMDRDNCSRPLKGQFCYGLMKNGYHFGHNQGFNCLLLQDYCHNNKVDKTERQGHLNVSYGTLVTGAVFVNALRWV